MISWRDEELSMSDMGFYCAERGTGSSCWSLVAGRWSLVVFCTYGRSRDIEAFIPPRSTSSE